MAFKRKGSKSSTEVEAGASRPGRPPLGRSASAEIRLQKACDELDLLGYRDATLLASGGMGDVYVASEVRTGERVAIKLIRHEVSDQENIRERFEAEARAMSKLHHPHIIRVHGFEQNGAGDPCLIMEYVGGRTLEEVLTDGRLPVREAVRIICQICDALSYAHDKKVFHRDIKPGNIVLSPQGDAKLGDFGLARLRDEPDHFLTVTGKVVGSAHYVPPERQAFGTGDDEDAAGDIFSVGVLMYRMLTGRLPLGNHPSASEVSATPPELDGVVGRAMAHAPMDRYDSAEEFKTAILAAVEEGRRPKSARAIRVYDFVWTFLGLIAVALAFGAWARTQVKTEFFGLFFAGLGEHETVSIAPVFLIPLTAALYGWGLLRFKIQGGDVPGMRVPRCGFLPSPRKDPEISKLHLGTALLFLLLPLISLGHLMRNLLQLEPVSIAKHSLGEKVSLWHYEPGIVTTMITKEEFRVGDLTFYPLFQPLLFVVSSGLLMVAALVYWKKVFWPKA